MKRLALPIIVLAAVAGLCEAAGPLRRPIRRFLAPRRPIRRFLAPRRPIIVNRAPIIVRSPVVVGQLGYGRAAIVVRQLNYGAAPVVVETETEKVIVREVAPTEKVIVREVAPTEKVILRQETYGEVGHCASQFRARFRVGY